MSEELAEASKRLSYADFLLSRSESNEYASGAFMHIYSACNIAIRALTNLNQIESESPRLTRDSLMKFESEESKKFAKFYEEVLGLKERSEFKRPEIEDKLRKAKEFLEWVQDRLIK